MQKTYRFGVEEEYFLSDIDSRGAVRNVSPRFIAAARAAFPGEVQREMLQSQIEVATAPCTSLAEARGALAALRSGLSSIGREHGLTVLAAGTHPSAVWSRQRPTAAARYDRLMRDLQMLGSRNQVCGLHVHVEVIDADLRTDIMTRMMPFLPLILALSTSSPFWQAQRTGLMGYRLAAYSELPRTGLPELFENAAEYQRYVDIMVETRAIQDSSFVWWAVRPSLRHPTLELRVADSCTRLDDTLAIAALFRCLVRHLERDRGFNSGLTATSRAIASENMWRAQRYGIHGGFVCEASRTMRPVADLLAQTLTLLDEDAAELDCLAELGRCADILTEGTSADIQLAIFEEARVRETEKSAALAAVVDWLANETRSGGRSRGPEQFPPMTRMA